MRAIKRLEDLPLLAAWHAAAAVEHAHADVLAVEVSVQLHLLALAGIFLRVGEQVHEDLRERVVVADHGIGRRRGLPARAEAALLQVQRVAFPRAPDDRVQVERFALDALLLPLEPGEIEHVIDQPREPLGLDHDDAEILRMLGSVAVPILHQLGKHADRGQRRLEFVRDVGNEIRLLLRARELAAGVGHHQPAAAGDRAERGDDEKAQRAPQRPGGFAELLGPLQIERQLPMRQRLADLGGDERPLPVASGFARRLRGDGPRLVVEQREHELRLLRARPFFARAALLTRKRRRPEIAQTVGLDETAKNQVRRLRRAEPEDDVELVLHEARDHALIRVGGQCAEIGSGRRELRDRVVVSPILLRLDLPGLRFPIRLRLGRPHRFRRAVLGVLGRRIRRKRPDENRAATRSRGLPAGRRRSLAFRRLQFDRWRRLFRHLRHDCPLSPRDHFVAGVVASSRTDVAAVSVLAAGGLFVFPQLLRPAEVFRGNPVNRRRRGASQPGAVVQEKLSPLRGPRRALRLERAKLPILPERKTDRLARPFLREFGGEVVRHDLRILPAEQPLHGVIESAALVINQRPRRARRLVRLRLVKLRRPLLEDDLLLLHAAQRQPPEHRARQQDGEEENPDAFFHRKVRSEPP